MDMVMPVSIANLNNYINTCNATAKPGSTTNQSNGRNSMWAVGRMAEGAITSTLSTPNSKNADCTQTSETGMLVLRSRHSGGVNVLMCDGSVHFLKDSINQTTFWALGTKAGGEVISADAY